MKIKKPVIVFLDAGTVDYGDISFKTIRALGSLRLYNQTLPAQMESRLKNASHVITNKCVFGPKLLSRLRPGIFIHVAATGVNIVDLKAARRHGIRVTHVSKYSTEPVAQFTLAFILALAGGLIPLNQAAHDGTWSRSPYFMLKPPGPVREISGKILGILGYGAIGKRVAKIAKAFGMRVCVARIPGRVYSKQESRKRLSLRRVLALSDFFSIHAPLTSLTRGLINTAAIRNMKKDACLINMARGGIVDERALRKALEKGWLAGAASDVLSEEPPPRNHPLLKAPRLLLTPHVAWASREARERLLREIVLNIQACEQGRKRNRIV